MKTIEQRFWPKVIKADGCWEWSASRDRRGYGRIGIKNTPHLAHRVSWEIHNKKLIPAGLMVMHSCDNTGCVNPGHLSVGTCKENNLQAVTRGRMVYSKRRHPNTMKTHCKYGHQFTAANTYIVFFNSKKWRQCRICIKKRNKLRLDIVVKCGIINQ